jgi:hypothetical protein
MIIVVDSLGTSFGQPPTDQTQYFCLNSEQRFHVSAASSIPLADQAIVSTRLAHF